MNRVFTEKEVSEIQAAEAGLRSSGLDVDHEYAQHNANLVMDHFEKNLNLPVTLQNIYALVESQKTSFVWRTAAQREFDKIAAENPAAAQQLADWLAKQGKPGTPVNTGDQAFENLTLLLIELRGRPVDSQRIHEAMGRISFKPGRQLHFVPEPRPVDSRQHQDDGTGFLGKTPVNEPRWKRISRERAEREAAEAKSATAVASATSAAVREAKQKAESIAGSTHAETDQLRKLFVTSGTEIDWQATLASRERMQAQFDKQRAVRRFVR